MAAETLTFEELRPGMKIEGKACRWEILGMPRFLAVAPRGGDVFEVVARVEWKEATYPSNVVNLKGRADDLLEVTL